MFKKITRAVLLSTFLLLYLTLEIALFKELGWQGGLMASVFFTAFAGASLASLIYRPAFMDIDEELDAEANRVERGNCF